MSNTADPREAKVEILIAEDSPTQAEQLRYVLERQGYGVTVANNGRQALELLDGFTPHLIITDIVMPEMDGFELCKRVKDDDRLRDIPVVMLTSLTASEDVLEGLASGADSFIPKPYHEDYLIANLQQIQANRRMSQTERVRIGVEISFGGKKRFITADQQQMLTLLISTYEAAVNRNAELIQSQNELRDFNDRLELMVEERTAELTAEIAERKRAEEAREKMEVQLRHAQKMEAVGRLAGGVAHDFNNILVVILGYSQILSDRLWEEDETHQFAVEIAKAADRASVLTRQLLSYARKQTIAPEVFDLNELVTNMLKMLGRLVGEDVTLQWRPAADPLTMKMDLGQVDQILTNLVVNARDAIANVGNVIIETDKVEFDQEYCQCYTGVTPGQYVMLAVSDDGIGMDKETLAHIYEPFFTTKELGKGTGLGLATVYGIVNQNLGHIHVYSEPGVGTTFRIYLPCLTEEEESRIAKAREVVETKTGTETVLLVEDDDMLLLLATRLLENMGYKVLPADRPGKALDILRGYAGEVHLLLTDVVMPEMNGRDLWKEVSALRPAMRCLFMSGYTADAIAHLGVLDDGSHFMPKPFSSQTLSTKVRGVLDT